TVGQALAQPLSVRVVNAQGKGVRGISVNWTVSSGGGSFPSGTVATDANGNSNIVWTLGTTPGSNTASANVSSLAGTSVDFTATAHAGPATGVTRVSGDNQSDTAGATLATALVI